MIIFRGLYGLKSSGTYWIKMFAETLRDKGFVTMVADPEVYIRQARKYNGEDYYELLLVYVDYVLW